MSLQKKEIKSLNWEEVEENIYLKNTEGGVNIIFKYSEETSEIFKDNESKEDLFSGSIPDRFHLEAIMMDKMIPFN